jgi:hypothetical protein
MFRKKGGRRLDNNNNNEPHIIRNNAAYDFYDDDVDNVDYINQLNRLMTFNNANNNNNLETLDGFHDLQPQRANNPLLNYIMRNNNNNNNVQQQGGDAIKEYTPLIKAIQEGDWHAILRLLHEGADPNERDNIEGWSPMKWTNYMYLYGPRDDNRNNQTASSIIGEILTENGVNITNDFDNNRIPFSYNFYPRINDNRRGYNPEPNTITNGGNAPTEQQRISSALNRNYTPLINAIIRGNIPEIRDLLVAGANPNQRDGIEGFNWCPLKWLAFAYHYNNVYNDEDEYEELLRFLDERGARTCYDDYHIREDSYNFYPVITTINEELEQLRRDAEEAEEEENNIPNRRNVGGGTRKRKARKSKSRKHKKTHKKGTRTSNKRRKHMKK